MTSAVSFFDIRDSFQDVKTPKMSTSASTDNTLCTFTLFLLSAVFNFFYFYRMSREPGTQYSVEGVCRMKR